jgi:hypothetical protein
LRDIDSSVLAPSGGMTGAKHIIPAISGTGH